MEESWQMYRTRPFSCGLSDKPDDSKFSYQLKNHAENILELVDSLKIDNESGRSRLGWGYWNDCIFPTPDRKIVLLKYSSLSVLECATADSFLQTSPYR